MKAIIDTNIIIDVILQREEFLENSYQTILLASQKRFDGFIISSAVSDIYYIIRKNLSDSKMARQAIADIAELVSICDTRSIDISAALVSDMPDFEDAIVAAVAKREKADYIVTRNSRDFQNSPIPALTPKEFLNKIENQD